jgi:hypothetical protein
MHFACIKQEKMKIFIAFIPDYSLALASGRE